MNPKAKILILEDDPYFVYPIKYHLDKAGYEVFALDVLENIENAQEIVFQYSPNIILCDIRMHPNGFEILKIIKGHSQLRLIPFIFLTGINSLPERIKAYLGGVDDFIVKPVNKEELMAKIGSILKRQAELEAAIYLDPLTQIYNRRFFHQELSRQIKLHRRHGDKFALVMMDLDHFKAINDNFGHTCGDQCLVSFTRFVQSQIRSTDILARWGGEEFLMILERSKSEGALHTLQKLLDDMRKQTMFKSNDQDVTITFSAGMAIFPDDGEDPKSIVDAADRAVYKAKELGRCRIELAR